MHWCFLSHFMEYISNYYYNLSLYICEFKAGSISRFACLYIKCIQILATAHKCSKKSRRLKYMPQFILQNWFLTWMMVYFIHSAKFGIVWYDFISYTWQNLVWFECLLLLFFNVFLYCSFSFNVEHDLH